MKSVTIAFLSVSSWLLIVFGLVLAQERPDWRKAWEKTVEGAKREGQVTVYMFGYSAVLSAFEKEYPAIKVISVTGSGSSLGNKIMSERRAGTHIADVFSGGANTAFNVLYKANALDPLRPAMILREVLNESNWWGGRLPFVDPEGKFVLAFISNPSSAQLYYNKNLLDPKTLKSFWELLDPQWKGKIVSLEPTNTSLGGAMQFLYRHPDLGPEFIKRLFGDMEVVFSRDSRQMTDWIAQGKFALCLGCRDAERARNQGLPIDALDTSAWKEGTALSVSGGTLSLLNKAPHPNAARLFVNWFLSKKGQTALQTLGDPNDPPNSRRVDIPKDGVAVNNRIIEGRKYLDITRPEWQDMEPIFKLAKEIMASRK